MNEFIETHIECPCGDSSDAYSVNKDGSGYCFSCSQYFKPPKEEETIIESNPVFNPDGVFSYTSHRGISENTFRYYDVFTKFVNDVPMELGFKYPNKAFKIRYLPEKKFWNHGPMKDAGLYGTDKFDPGSKEAIVITEGELDALSVYEMLRGNVAAVSVKSASSAKKDCIKDWEYINSFKKIVLCLDADEHGEKATQDVASLFDFNKVYQVKFHRFKDPNEYLQNDGMNDFVTAFKNARRFAPDNIISSFSEIEEALNLSQEDQIGTYPFGPLNERLFGLHQGEVIVFKGPEGIGKQLPITTRVPTPNGWTTMGDLKVGDFVFGKNGKQTKVIYKTDIQYNIPCYKITFNDKTSQIAGGPHRWGVLDTNNKYFVKTTEEILKEGVLIDLPNGFAKARYYVPITSPVEYNEKELLIDPYLLGYWLGDGHSYSADISVGDQDINNWNEEYRIRRDKTAWVVRHPELTHKKLISLNLIKNKHIPEIYLRGSINQRVELLKGLLDSDGHGSKTGVEFYNTNKILIDQVLELIQSLGYVPRLRKKQGKLNGVVHKDIYTIWFLVRDGNDVFKLRRKAESTKKCTTTRLFKKAIRKIEPVESVPSVCIQVNSDDHLYLIENYLVTHNTEIFRAIEHHLLKTTDKNIGLIHLEEDNGTTIKAIAGYELEVPAVLPDCGLSKEDILRGYKQAVRDNEGRVHLYSSFDVEDEETLYNNIRFLVAAAGCKFIFLDHITWLATGMESEDERKKLDRISQKLKLLAKELKFCLIEISHTNDEGKSRGSRNITKVANTVIHMFRDLVNPDPIQRSIVELVIEKARLGGRTGPAGKAIFNTMTGKLEEYQG